MRTIHQLLLVALFACAALAACPSASYVDNFSNLPAAPVFPTAVLAAANVPKVSAANPLTQDHWSEKANLAAYRPPKETLTTNPTTSNCPHLQTGLKNWHDSSTWAGAGIPSNGANINIPANTNVLVSSCSIDPAFVFGVIYIPSSSKLVFADANINISAVGFRVEGGLLAGSATCRLRSKLTITLYGSRSAQALPADPWIKGISVQGVIDLHGALYTPTWTRLALSARPGDTWIFIQDIVNWQPGQRIAITTTELKDARDWHRNEERNIVSVQLATSLGKSVTAIQLDQPLTYLHFGGKEYQAEVALLSRNIVVQGDAINSAPTDTTPVACTTTGDSSTYPCENSFLTGFGAHIIVNGSYAQGRFSGVEMYRVGQTNVLGRYPIHFHLIGNITSTNYAAAFVRDSSVHDSYFRCYAIHGTSGVKVSQNTAYNAIGHCYFLEDGVEENNIFEYNQAAHVHALGPYVNPSIDKNNDNWGGQQLSWYSDGPNLLLPSDMAAGCFYVTNTYNDFVGNAASGGWAGFSIPSLQLPVKLFYGITNFSPRNRPFRSAFRGNSAHSSGYWWATAGGIYVGGELQQKSTAIGGLLYTSGRSASRDTCSNTKSGTPDGDGGCWGSGDRPLWLRFEDNKVFLANRGMQNWGNRAEIIRFELHDVSLAMNVFGQVWIDDMVMECRSGNNPITWMNGCPAMTKEATDGNAWSKCNVRDYTFFSSFGGFQWYDVGQQHILTNSVFRNCRADWPRCVNGPARGNCSNIAVFTSLTHSDQFVPELMQVTSGITYQNVTDLWRYTTKLSDATGLTVSGRLQSWLDADGTASLMPGKRVMIGSKRAEEWWKYNDLCVNYLETYKCPMGTGDSAASFIMRQNPTQEAGIGSTICLNGNWNGNVPCPVVAQVSHFGRGKNESLGLAVAANAKVTGPIIAQAGGWFIRFTKGTPKLLTFDSAQVAQNDVLLLALPYPAGTTFTIWNQGASWCGPAWATCRHNYTAVTSVAAVRSAFGDAYFWDNNAKTLYLRLVSIPDTFQRPDVKSWTPFPPQANFTRGGQTLTSGNFQASVIIQASCSSDPCAPQPTVTVPAGLNLAPVTTASVATPVPATPRPSSSGSSNPATSAGGSGSATTDASTTDASSGTVPTPSTAGATTNTVTDPTKVISPNGSAALAPSIFVVLIASCFMAVLA